MYLIPLKHPQSRDGASLDTAAATEEVRSSSGEVATTAAAGVSVAGCNFEASGRERDCSSQGSGGGGSGGGGEEEGSRRCDLCPAAAACVDAAADVDPDRWAQQAQQGTAGAA